ncbi:nitroreductase family protein [Snodgrassella communis]|uniref:nitroreductase family protein n=1 Tax=Snodgrassella communis TaxID=2946699 RepID=UPI0011855212|nr:nitroreductase family protein [Snodgrassella communis]
MQPAWFGISTDIFIQGVQEAIIATQSVVIAAESMGLGSVYLSSIQNDIRPLIQILKLPKLTFPLVAMQIGIPAQMPERKPRLPLATRSFEIIIRMYLLWPILLNTIKLYKLITAYVTATSVLIHLPPK